MTTKSSSRASRRRSTRRGSRPRRSNAKLVPVVVKALRKAGLFAFGHRESDIAYFELLYLEFLRGEAGIPVLYGGWTTPSHVVWVTSNGGRPVAQGRGTRRVPAMFPAQYNQLARDAPLALAKAWFKCFRSFGERGGFVLTDFKPEQFTFDDRGHICLVDGPAPNSGPSPTSRGATSQNPDLEPGKPWSCEDNTAAMCGRRTYKYHHCPVGKSGGYCQDQDDGGPLSAPELTECRNGTCAAFDWRVHVYDVAAKSWLLPRIIRMAADRDAAKKLKALAATMTAADPRDRPTFDALLRRLAA
ncbi:hypothetical protein JL720_2000 [Aureococcus anophagefferens]|nr:hypothetical protein JL720_2000 [Aureococcus anophagefferens]